MIMNLLGYAIVYKCRIQILKVTMEKISKLIDSLTDIKIIVFYLEMFILVTCVYIKHNY